MCFDFFNISSSSFDPLSFAASTGSILEGYLPMETIKKAIGIEINMNHSPDWLLQIFRNQMNNTA